MFRFHDLTVVDVRKTIPEAVVVTLRPESGNFDFIQGQYLTFRKEFDGEELRRSYSICVESGSALLQIGVKQVDGGRFSTWVNERVQPGDVLQALEPMGKFHTSIEPRRSKHYLGFAGGSGITPILSILRTVLSQEPHSRFSLIYANRSLKSVMFREELDDIKNHYIERFSIMHVLEQQNQDVELFTGRVTPEKCAALLHSWINADSVETTFVCGPEPMRRGIVEALRASGFHNDTIKFEHFGATQRERQKHRERTSTEASNSLSTDVVISLDGDRYRFTMDRRQSILDAALANALDAPYACKAGVCSTCKCKVLAGEVDMLANHALGDHETKKGYILSCQSYPISANLEIAYDQ